MVLIEICLEGVESAVIAAQSGADRIELCANLLEGGTTPSFGTISLVKELLDKHNRQEKNKVCPVNIMIRPRGGDFLYNQYEFEEMKRDIVKCKEIGVNGVVFGILLPNGSVDVERTVELAQLASPLQVTFHRAFDVCRDPFEAVRLLASIPQIQRILTSGQEPSVLEGIPMLNELLAVIKEEKLDIQIMPGCGINPRNKSRILTELGSNVKEIHMALPSEIPSEMQYRNDRGVFMGVQLSSSEYAKTVTSQDLVRKVCLE